ncbi:MAG: hypothetical protein NC432_04590 [Roseburia sp.]|nr:hypothetical protein [Roseburia sp.]MCM1096978.1 hypothetical protein [Ruminococcus flavefaciens]
MKKNLLSVLILVLLIVNIAMTAVMMISVTGTNKKTAELITPILSALNFELYNPDGTAVTDVPLSETETYVMTEMMIPLAPAVNADGTVSSKQEYLIFTPSLLQNTKHKDYKKMGGADNMAAADSIIRDIINTVISQYTLEDWKKNPDQIREEILKEIQSKFDSNFIYQIAMSDVKYG